VSRLSQLRVYSASFWWNGYRFALYCVILLSPHVCYLVVVTFGPPPPRPLLVAARLRHHCTPSFVEAATTPSVHHDLCFPTTVALPPIVSNIAQRTCSKSRVWYRCLSRRSWYGRRWIGNVSIYNAAEIIHYSCLATADVQPSTLNPTADCATPQLGINRLARSPPTATGNDQLFSSLTDRLVLPAFDLSPRLRHVSTPAVAQ